MQRLQSIKNEIDRVNLEIQSAERDYDLNRAAELKYGTVLQLQKQLKEAEEALEKEAVSTFLNSTSQKLDWMSGIMPLICISVRLLGRSHSRHTGRCSAWRCTSRPFGKPDGEIRPGGSNVAALPWT